MERLEGTADSPLAVSAASGDSVVGTVNRKEMQQFLLFLFTLLSPSLLSLTPPVNQKEENVHFADFEHQPTSLLPVSSSESVCKSRSIWVGCGKG